MRSSNPRKPHAETPSSGTNSRSSFFRSFVYELVEDWASAERELRSAFEQFDAVADRGVLQILRGRLARVLAETGKVDEAEEHARWASRACWADDFHEQVSWRQGLALVEAHQGRYAEAHRFACEAVDLAGRSDWLFLHADDARGPRKSRGLSRAHG